MKKGVLFIYLFFLTQEGLFGKKKKESTEEKNLFTGLFISSYIKWCWIKNLAGVRRSWIRNGLTERPRRKFCTFSAADQSTNWGLLLVTWASNRTYSISRIWKMGIKWYTSRGTYYLQRNHSNLAALIWKKKFGYFGSLKNRKMVKI